MRMCVGLLLVVGIVALGVPKQAHAMQVRMLDRSLSLGDVGAMGVPVATAGQLKLHLDGSGDGSGMNPGISALLSAAIPGLGQVFNGQVLKGVGFFLGVGLLFGVGGALVSPDMILVGLGLQLVGLVVYIWNIYDAYAVAASGPGSGGDIDTPAPVSRPSLVSVVDSARQRSNALPSSIDVPLAALTF